ncbi:MAG: PepSY domain-containing protein [Nitrospira sp.]
MQAALGSIAGQVVEAGLEKPGDKTMWNVDVLTNKEGIMAIYIDAVSGVVVMTEETVAGKRLGQDKLS